MNAGVDIAIVGGGVVGATLALLLAKNARVDARNILLIEREPPLPPATDAPFDLRVSAISPGNRATLGELGVWSAMDVRRIANYERMVVWHEAVPPDSPDVLRFDAAELGEPDLGSIVENRALQAALLARCAGIGVQLRRESVTALSCDADSARLNFGSDCVRAELVVGADGAASSVRSWLGIDAHQHDYLQRGIVATVRAERGHQNTAWQRFLSTGPLALLPLPGGECSIVWSAVNAKADALLALSAVDFNTALTDASAAVLGRMTLASERAAFPLRRVAAARYISTRCALVGDAAHVIHPLAGQGVNQGLQDAITLAESISLRPARESVGAANALQRYERERRAGNALMRAAVDGLDGLFTNAPGWRSGMAREGMALVGRSALAKRLFFTRAAAGRFLPRR
jgi:2-octaprenylphenol hydroxylase